jgi:hypothetical protein
MYFIYDCNGNIAGNNKGYLTIKGAIRQQDTNKSIVNAIWKAFDNRKDKSNLEVSSVRFANNKDSKFK